MEVTFATHYLDESAGFGMARYSRHLVDALRASGISVRTLQCDPKWHSGIKSGFDFFLNMPMKSVLDASKSIFHLAAPQAGISAPLVKTLRHRKVVSTVYAPLLPGHRRLSTAPVAYALKTGFRNSDRMVAISSLAKDDAVSALGLDPDPTIHVYEGTLAMPAEAGRPPEVKR